MKLTITVDPRTIIRREMANAKRDAMRHGVVLRAQTFRPKKGKGAYKRRTKHRGYT